MVRVVVRFNGESRLVGTPRGDTSERLLVDACLVRFLDVLPPGTVATDLDIVGDLMDNGTVELRVVAAAGPAGNCARAAPPQAVLGRLLFRDRERSPGGVLLWQFTLASSERASSAQVNEIKGTCNMRDIQTSQASNGPRSHFPAEEESLMKKGGLQANDPMLRPAAAPGPGHVPRGIDPARRLPLQDADVPAHLEQAQPLLPRAAVSEQGAGSRLRNCSETVIARQRNARERG